MINLSQRLKNAANSLMNGKPTSRELMTTIPANNPPDYFKMLRHDYGITILKEKVKDKRHYRFWIPECEKPKVREWLARFTEQANQNINKQTKQINKSTKESHYDNN